jgi:hypothetical protein
MHCNVEEKQAMKTLHGHHSLWLLLGDCVLQSLQQYCVLPVAINMTVTSWSPSLLMRADHCQQRTLRFPQVLHVAGDCSIKAGAGGV